MDPRRLFGNSAEQLAARFLKAKRYTIVDRQFRTRFGEIDLIAKDGDEIVFVEVKARKGSRYGHPEESVTEVKLQKISAALHEYLAKHPADAYRIDVIAIEYGDGEPVIHHLIGVG